MNLSGSPLGTFLEFSLRVDDVLESLHFYRTLGFHDVEIGDVWSHKYAVISDGELCIGLHERDFDSPAITFVRTDLARHARSMTDHGFEFSYLQLDEEAFNEIRFADRDGHAIILLEARTFSGVDDNTRDSACGTWFELTLPVKDAVHAASFWAPLAPAVLQVREDPTVHMRFDAGGLPLGLSESIALDRPSLCFKCQDRAALASLIETHSYAHEMFPGFEGAFVVLRAPEGTPLYVFDEDIVGEAYVVDESDDVSEFPDAARPE